MSDCCSSKNTNKLSEHIDINDDNSMVCYCFKKTVGNIKRDPAGVLSDIKAKMKDPGCFCEKANPSKKCCLSDVIAVSTSHSKA